jgi:methyl-accepting chemotaxis protein
MSTHNEIDKAISAHGMWKQKLRQAIDTGECESTPERVKCDNNCSFGKWLYERIDPQVKNMPQYHDVVALHAKFHKEAGAILALALEGHKNEAKQCLALGSEFSKVSANLTKKMHEWQKALA